MKKFKVTMSVLGLVVIAILFQNFTPSLSDLQIIEKNLIRQALKLKTPDAKLSQYLAGFNPHASVWNLHTNTDAAKDLFINYDDTGKSWPAYQHLVRLKLLSIAYNQEDSIHYHSSKIVETINAGLNFWFRKMTPPAQCNKTAPVRCSSAWTRNELWQQSELGLIFLLMDSALPANYTRIAVKNWLWDITQSLVRNSDEGWGANQIAFAKNQILRGVLRARVGETQLGIKDIDDAVRGRLGMEPLLIRTTVGKDGIQPDWSFRQHKMLYSIGYGSNMIAELATYQRYILKGTSLKFSEKNFSSLMFAFLKGQARMVRGTVADYGAFGRFMTQPSSSDSAKEFAVTADDLAEMSPPGRYKELLLSFSQHVRGEGKSYAALGNAHFWNADFMTHQRVKYYTSVRLSSFRNGSSENIGAEMPKGFWTGYGMNLLMKDGSEYRDVFPLWDWSLIPGVTAPRTVPKVTGADYYKGAFAAGISNSEFGASAFVMQNVSGTTAFKSWFFFDDVYVSLGAGIASSSPFPVNTSINQTLLKSAIAVNGQTLSSLGEVHLNAVKSVHHNRVGYIFPTPSKVSIFNNRITGDWRNIRAGLSKPMPVQKDIFGLWLTHGKNPLNGQYAYITYPDIDASDLNNLVTSNPIQILANSKKVQAVKHTGHKFTQAVFFNSGILSINASLRISVTDAALLMYDEKNKIISVSQPPQTLQDQKTLNVKLLNPKTGNATSYNIALPAGNGLGSTISIAVVLP